MDNITVKVFGDDSTLHVNKDVSGLKIEDGKILIDFEDGERVVHRTDMTDEVIVKFNR